MPEFFCPTCGTKLPAEGANCATCEQLARERAEQEAAQKLLSKPAKSSWSMKLAIAASVLALIGLIVFFLYQSNNKGVDRANDLAANTVREIVAANEKYAAGGRGRACNLAALESMKLVNLPPSAEFRFSLFCGEAEKQEPPTKKRKYIKQSYMVGAVPVTSSGNKVFCSNETGIIRYTPAGNDPEQALKQCFDTGSPYSAFGEH